MNKLSSYNFEPVYFDEKIKDFYSVVLKNAINYQRVSAYFSRGILCKISSSLPSFIRNGGYMQLLLSHNVSSEELKIIIDAYKNKTTNKIDKKTIYETVKKMCDDNDYDLLSYLISIGRLDIKICYQENGTYHKKYGIVSDNTGNELVYVGSNNFTVAATELNSELFQVTTNWDSPSKNELKFIKQMKDEFLETWNNEKDNIETFELPDPFIDALIDSFDHKEVEKLNLKPNYVKFDIKEDRTIILKSNIELDPFLTFKNIGSLINFLEVEGNDHVFKNSFRVNEMHNLFMKISEIFKDKALVTLSLRARKFFEINYRNYKELEKIGHDIKSDDFFNSDDFLSLKKDINSCVNRELKDKQIQAAAHIINMQRSLNFSVPGSGKTATVLGAFEYLSSPLSRYNHVSKLLVIGPRNCAKSWKDEYCTLTKSKGTEYHPLSLINEGPIFEKKDVLNHDFASSRIILINYDLICKIKHELINLVDENTMIVFDEIHKVKKTDTEKFDALKEIVKNTKYRIALTGTPLPNGYIDMFNMLFLLHDDFVFSYFGMYSSILKSYDDVYRKTGIQNDLFNKKLEPFYIRVNKDDLNVPKANEDHIIKIYANDYEKRCYYNEKYKKGSSSFGGACNLVKVGTLPKELFDNNKIVETFDIDSVPYPSKIKKLIDNIKESKDKKCVIWCDFIVTIKYVYRILLQLGYIVSYIFGETPIEEREEIIDNFNYGNVQILITNPATLAESVSLHKKCHIAHYLELDYNLYHFLQSKDRIHRLGLKSSDETDYYIYINFYDNIKDESKDLEIYNALLKKEILQKKAIDKGNFIFANKNEESIGDYK